MPQVFLVSLGRHNGLVGIIDPDVPDSFPGPPDADTGVRIGEHGIAVASRPDEMGGLELQLWVMGDYLPAGRRLLAKADLPSAQGRYCVGAVAGTEFRELRSRPGTHSVAVYVHDTDDGPDEVCFLLDG